MCIRDSDWTDGSQGEEILAHVQAYRQLVGGGRHPEAVAAILVAVLLGLVDAQEGRSVRLEEVEMGDLELGLQFFE